MNLAIDLSVGQFVIVALAVLCGSLIQGSVGLGLGLVAAPVTALVDPTLIPGTLLWLAAVLPILTLVADAANADWRGLAWAFTGRVPATVLGAWVVSIVSAQVMGLLVGGLVLAAVVLTTRSFRLPKRRSVLVAAGVVSGVSGTATSIGGPPLALVYQHEPASRIRSTLAVYFVGGAALSLTVLAMVGELTARQGVLALWLAPLLVGGFALSGLVRRHLRPAAVRAAVLVVCAAAALALIARSLLG